ncbi:MAG: class I SAM-dependent DNA methyltransferase [Verrucomicrobia bacterium]|jgi:type II restriction/modification system DNA methylase subunit YeeA|nr:class I SAM-dependent DNA methyltransferase [Verrucomicrobiota bacterium]
MTAEAFIAKWRQVDLTERSAAQAHFLDLCELVGHPKPQAADPKGEWFTFERGAVKHGGGDGWADVWKKDFFGWEYKGRHKDLGAAYNQLLEYRADLDNPPLLVVCDLDIIRVHTNFNNAPTRIHEITLATLDQPRSLEILEAVFHAPDKLRPGVTSEAITEKASGHFAAIAGSMRQRGLEPQAVAHFLVRVVFCLFAEDVGLLERGLFTRLVTRVGGDPKKFARHVGDLFSAMATGGDFLLERIRHFNGSLFDATPVLELTTDEIAAIGTVAGEDWSAVDVSISGTLFERGLNPAKRSQQGSHYTGRPDIETIVEPVVLAPLRREWAAVRAKAEKFLNVESLLSLSSTGGDGLGKGANPTAPGQGTRPTTCRPGAPTGQSAVPAAHPTKKSRSQAEKLVLAFLERLKTIRVLDPAGGSGNFLYVTLQKLLELEKAVNHFLREHGFTPQFPQVNPLQLHCLEIDPYAHDLAQTVVWIGYIQWLRANGYGFPAEPILKRMSANFRCADALFTDWPEVDFIVGNPPFLGDKLMRGQLGDEYVEKLRKAFEGRIPGQSDFCCYWFEKARELIEQGKCKRAGLLATQGIRGGANREVLKRIKESGDIFFAVSDRDWILDGANVHISLVAFDDGTEKGRRLDGLGVEIINSNLTSMTDFASATPLMASSDTAFIGTTKGGSFDIAEEEALELLKPKGNPNGRPNSDVLKPILNGFDILRREPQRWLVDNEAREVRDAAGYEGPHRLVVDRVKPHRDTNRDKWLKENWWKLQRIRPEMRSALAPLRRFIATPRVSKHRVCCWFEWPMITDDQTVVFAREDDCFFGIVHSRIHEVWALQQGTRLETRPRYTPTTCFETFPFPFPDGLSSAVRRDIFVEPAREKNPSSIGATYSAPDGAQSKSTVASYKDSAPDGAAERGVHANGAKLSLRLFAGGAAGRLDEQRPHPV